MREEPSPLELSKRWQVPEWEPAVIFSLSAFICIAVITLFSFNFDAKLQNKLDKNKNSSRKMCVPLRVVGVRVMFCVKKFPYF